MYFFTEEPDLVRLTFTYLAFLSLDLRKHLLRG